MNHITLIKRCCFITLIINKQMFTSSFVSTSITDFKEYIGPRSTRSPSPGFIFTPFSRFCGDSDDG